MARVEHRTTRIECLIADFLVLLEATLSRRLPRLPTLTCAIFAAGSYCPGHFETVRMRGHGPGKVNRASNPLGCSERGDRRSSRDPVLSAVAATMAKLTVAKTVIITSAKRQELAQHIIYSNHHNIMH